MQVLKLTQALLPSVPTPAEIVHDGEPLAVLAKHASKPQTAELVSFFAENGNFVDVVGGLFLPLLHQIYSVHSSKTVRSLVRSSYLRNLHIRTLLSSGLPCWNCAERVLVSRALSRRFRVQCISTTLSLLYLSSPAQLSESLHGVPLSVFVKSLLSDADTEAIAAGLVITALLMDKMPAVFVTNYAKEGTSDALRRVAAHAPSPAAKTLQVYFSATCSPPSRLCYMCCSNGGHCWCSCMLCSAHVGPAVRRRHVEVL